jgi:hypothetical protein
VVSLRRACRLSQRVGCHSILPKLTSDGRAFPCLTWRTRALATKGSYDLEKRHPLMSHSPQLFSCHFAGVAPDRMAFRPDLGSQFQLPRMWHRTRDLAPPCHLRMPHRRSGPASNRMGSAIRPEYCGYFYDAGVEGSACRSHWCCGPASARGTPQARGSNRRLLCRRFRTQDPSRKPSFFPELSRRRPNNARRPAFAAAALVMVSIRTCSCCPPIRPAASTDCRIRAAT